MEYIVQRLGSEVTFEDAMQIHQNDYGKLLKMYGFKEKLPLRKHDRALVLLRCMKSKPVDVFMLPIWHPIPVGTMFVSSKYHPNIIQDKPLFAMVMGERGKHWIELALVETDVSRGFRPVQQTDENIIRNVGFTVCKDARPSSKLTGDTICMRPEIVVEEMTVQWAFVTSGWRGHPVKYNPYRNYFAYSRHRVSKDWAHPWLDRDLLQGSIAVQHLFEPGYDSKTSKSCVRYLRSAFRAEHARHLIDYPVVARHDDCPVQTTLADVLDIVCECVHIPATSCDALARVNKNFKTLMEPYVQNHPGCSQRRLNTMISAMAKVHSPREIFRRHACSWIRKCVCDYASNHRRGGVFKYEIGLMPYETPYVMKIAIGYTRAQLLDAENLEPISLFLPRNEQYLTFGVYNAGDVSEKHLDALCLHAQHKHFYNIARTLSRHALQSFRMHIPLCTNVIKTYVHSSVFPRP